MPGLCVSCLLLTDLDAIVGAYMNRERELSVKNSYKSPILPNIEETHATFNYCMIRCLENIDRYAFGRLACGTTVVLNESLLQFKRWLISLKLFFHLSPYTPHT